MLKFSGYPYLIRGQPKKFWGYGRQLPSVYSEKFTTLRAKQCRHSL